MGWKLSRCSVFSCARKSSPDLMIQKSSLTLCFEPGQTARASLASQNPDKIPALSESSHFEYNYAEWRKPANLISTLPNWPATGGPKCQKNRGLPTCRVLAVDQEFIPNVACTEPIASRQKRADARAATFGNQLRNSGRKLTSHSPFLMS